MMTFMNVYFIADMKLITTKGHLNSDVVVVAVVVVGILVLFSVAIMVLRPPQRLGDIV